MKPALAFWLICIPLKHLYINSDFGYRYHPFTNEYALHEGVDLRARHDTAYAIMNGTVEAAGYNDRLGLFIRLRHDQFQSCYGHLSITLIETGDTVRAGDPIGITGATGRVTGEHLHFSLQYRHHYIDPIKFLYQTLINQDHGKQIPAALCPGCKEAGSRTYGRQLAAPETN